MTDMNFESPPADPIAICRTWFAEAESRTSLPNPNAMALSTVDEHGHPSCRMVLRKGFDERGPVFYTNRQSRKGCDLDGRKRAALLFFWDVLDRQIRFEGPVAPVADEEADAYFATRPRGSQIGAWVSDQSRPGASEEGMAARVAQVEARFDGGDVPRPPHWTGFRLHPERIEFWQGGEFRLHRRLVYLAAEDGWITQRLWP